MRTQTEAPVVEPRAVQSEDAGVTLAGVREGVRRRRGAAPACRCARGRGETLAVVGPSGCGKSTLLELVCGLQAPDAGTIDAPPAALMPQHDGLLPWLSALDNAGLALRVAGRSKARGARGGARALRRVRARGLRARAARRAVGRHAPARRVPAHAAGRAAAAVPRRAVRRARRADPRAAAARGWRARWCASRGPCCWSPTTSRRRCCWPTGSCCCRRGPAAWWPSSSRRAAAPARADRPEGRRAARARAARAGGRADGARKVLLPAASCCCSSPAGRRSCAPAGSTTSSCPRRRRSRTSLWEDRAPARHRPRGHRPGGAASGLAAAVAVGALLGVAMHVSRRAAARCGRW